MRTCRSTCCSSRKLGERPRSPAPWSATSSPRKQGPRAAQCFSRRDERTERCPSPRRSPPERRMTDDRCGGALRNRAGFLARGPRALPRVHRRRVPAGLSAAGADARRLQARGHCRHGVGARPLARPADEQPPAAPAGRRHRDPELPRRCDAGRRRTLRGADRFRLRPASRRVEAHVPPALAGRVPLTRTTRTRTSSAGGTR